MPHAAPITTLRLCVGTLLVSSVEGDIGVEILSDVLNNFLEAKVRRSLREANATAKADAVGNT